MKFNFVSSLLASACVFLAGTINGDSPLHRITLDGDNGVWPFSDAVSVDLSNVEKFVFVSGQVGEDSTGELHEDTIEEATSYAMDNVERILKAAGSDWDHVVSVQIFLRDMDDRTAMNEEYRKRFPAGEFPARRTTQSDTGYRIEMSVIAVVAKTH